MLVRARSSSVSSVGCSARHARSSHVCCSVDNGSGSTCTSVSGGVSVAVNGGPRVVYGEKLVAVYNAASPLRGVRGQVLTPADAEYDVARRVWNASVEDRKSTRLNSSHGSISY